MNLSTRSHIRYALVQHPMYLLIWLGDVVLGEKMPPWGAPDIWKYIERYRNNLSLLAKYPSLKINYETSALELEDLREKAPDVIEKMRNLVEEKRIGFVGGTYSQPHIHVFGPESNIMQFVFGLEAYKRLFDHRVITYAVQEVAHHQQLPQLLLASGYKYAVTPMFLWTIRFKDEHELIGTPNMYYCPVEGEEFTYWEGLDGSSIPLYLTTNEEPNRENVERERMKGLFRKPPVWIYIPDMLEIDERSVNEMVKAAEPKLMGELQMRLTPINEIMENAEPCLLDLALQERLGAAPPRTRAALYTYWSYCEGMWGEALSRKNHEAESSVIRCGSLSSMCWLLTGLKPKDTDGIWRKILSAQHHDVYWPETRELKKLALQWLDESIAESQREIENTLQSILSKIDTNVDGEPLIVFNHCPWPRDELLETTVDLPHGYRGIAVHEGDEEVPCYWASLEPHEDGSIKRAKIAFEANVPAYGYNTYSLHRAPGTEFERRPASCIETLENRFFRVKVDRDLNLHGMVLKDQNLDLLDPDKYLGNELRYAQIGNDRVEWQSNRGTAETSRVMVTPVFTSVESSGKMAGIPYRRYMRLCGRSRRIDFETKLTFEGHSIGDFDIDESKLNVYWPSCVKGDVYYEIPFGAMKGRESRPLLAINWLAISSDNATLAYLNAGTPKHWVQSSVIANVLAWGGTSFDNRSHIATKRLAEQVKVDCRLYGDHTYQYALYAEGSSWSRCGLARIGKDYSEPLVAKQTSRHKGGLPRSKSLLGLRSSNIVASSVLTDGTRLIMRAYESVGMKTGLSYDTQFSTEKVAIGNAFGHGPNRVDENPQINPFEIFTLIVTPSSLDAS